jgi:hypothetical protein
MQGVRLARNGLGVVIFGGIARVIEGMAQWVADRPQYCTSRKGWQVKASCGVMTGGGGVACLRELVSRVSIASFDLISRSSHIPLRGCPCSISSTY